MSSTEILLRVAGVVLLGLLAGILLHSRRRDQTAGIAAALCVSVGAFMLTSMPGAAKLLGVVIYPLTAICATHPVWFWLFCLAVFGDQFKLERRHWLCVATMALAGVAYQAMFEPSSLTPPAPLVRAMGIVFGAASLAFVVLGPLAVRAGGSIDLDERRRRIRSWFVPAVSTYLAVVVLVQVWVVLAGRPTPPVLVVANLAIIDTLAGLALASFLRIRVVNWLDLAERPAPADSLSPLERHVLDRLTGRMASERLYAREGLTVAGLAELLGTQEHVLRRVVNRGLGFRNFNDFLHTHRLREAVTRLRDPAARRLPVLTIALDAGYGSIGPFNRAFRERFGVTPSEYRREATASFAPDGPPGVRTQPSPR
jgi:AraC-like DNA-binding protein